MEWGVNIGVGFSYVIIALHFCQLHPARLGLWNLSVRISSRSSSRHLEQVWMLSDAVLDMKKMFRGCAAVGAHVLV